MARVNRLNFFSRRFSPASREEARLGEVEKYLGQQSMELYQLLFHMEKRLEALEEKASGRESKA